MQLLVMCLSKTNSKKVRAGDGLLDQSKFQKGPCRGLNPGPPAPKAGIIPLDHTDSCDVCTVVLY